MLKWYLVDVKNRKNMTNVLVQAFSPAEAQEKASQDLN